MAETESNATLAALPGNVRSKVALIDSPTRLEHARLLSTSRSNLWIKHDDETHRLYGGNKVRKLEYLLAEAKRQRAEQLLTVGAVGSHHVLATALFGRQHGFAVAAVLVPQPRTAHALSTFRAALAQGLHAVPARRRIDILPALARMARRNTMFIPPGGSNLFGALGYVDAACELAKQIRDGEMPEPNTLLVTLGSGGTAAGLAAGLALSGLKTKVVGIAVATPVWTIEAWTRHLARSCRKAFHAQSCRNGFHAQSCRNALRPEPQARVRLHFDTSYLGAGYGHITEAGLRATELAGTIGLRLDPTYTSKTFAAALDWIATGEEQNVLYWHTLSSAPLESFLVDAPNEREIDPPLLKLFEMAEREQASK